MWGGCPQGSTHTGRGFPPVRGFQPLSYTSSLGTRAWSRWEGTGRVEASEVTPELPPPSLRTFPRVWAGSFEQMGGF